MYNRRAVVGIQNPVLAQVLLKRSGQHHSSAPTRALLGSECRSAAFMIMQTGRIKSSRFAQRTRVNSETRLRLASGLTPGNLLDNQKEFQA
jgi:hypothetical protein